MARSAKNMRLHEIHRRTAVKSMAGGPAQGELIRDESMIRGKASASPALSIARQGVIRPAQACSQKALSAN
jgi:hypothetical protein